MKRYVIERSTGHRRDESRTTQGCRCNIQRRARKTRRQSPVGLFYAVDAEDFCIYLAEKRQPLKSKLSGFPATKVTEVRTIIDLLTAAA